VPDPASLGEGARRTAGLFSSLFTLRRDTTRDNDLVLREFEDMARWARDDSKREGEALDAVKRDMAGRGLLDSGIRRQEEGRVRAEFGTRWRNRKSEGERRIRDIRYSENLFHAAYRVVARKPWPHDPYAEEVSLLTGGWEKPELGTQPVVALPALNLKVEYGQQPVGLPLDPANPAAGRFFYLGNVVITNRSEERVSLMPFLALELNSGGYVELDQKAVPLVPHNFTGVARLLRGPLEIEPKRSVHGDFGFAMLGPEEQTLFGADFEASVKCIPPGLPVTYLVLRDLVSGEELAHEVTHPKMMRAPGPLSLRQLRDRKREEGAGEPAGEER
jgi:hypothetical protein